jgi:type IV pilus assembly protein PilF
VRNLYFNGYNNIFSLAMKTVLNLRRLVLVLCFALVLLQACQQGTILNAEGAQAQKRKDAASYNTQLGMAYLKQGDRPRAKRKLLTALDLAPNSADVNVAMAYYLEKTGDVKEAHRYYQQALSLAPTSGAQLNNYGAFLCRLGRYKEAEAYFLKAVKDVQYVHTAEAYENAGLCATAIPDYPKAENYFTRALKHDPLRKQSLYELVRLERKQNHNALALRYLQRYPRLSLSDANLLAMAIDLSHKMGNAKAEAAYKKRWARLNNFTDSTGAMNEYDSNNR